MAIITHPFDPLGPEEIKNAAALTRNAFPDTELNFRVITLKEPAKRDMLEYLEQEQTKLNGGRVPPRTARVQVVLQDKNGSGQLYELHVDLTDRQIRSKEHIAGRHPFIDSQYMKEVEDACQADERVQAEIRKLQLPADATVCIEVWAYATDGMTDMTDRTTMCWFFMRLLKHPDANFYAYPLDLCAEVSEKLEVTKVYRLPSSKDEVVHDEAAPFDRNRIHATEASEYYPDLRPPPRSTTRPYHVSQPEGPSFETQGNHVSWEKWSFRVGFNYREGLVLHNVRYEDRSLFYRLSLTEMFVPYADPRAPYPRKGAFDLGNDGAGVNANNLRLGCDCLGSIKYFDAWHNTNSGEPVKLPNVVCCHEQDDGILWKHTNFRTQNAVVTRARVLVLQTVITVSNYEYIFAFHFGQDASIHYEVRATGIMSTAPIGMGETVPYGTVVAPGTMAPFHQHLFSLRIDPAIDGMSNSLQVEESIPMPLYDPEVHNPFGVGYTAVSSYVENETGLDLDFTKNRTFKIVNEQKINPITQTPVGFKIIPSYSTMLLAHPSSYHAKRSEFGQHAIWVTRYDDEEIFPSGRHTMQSLGGEGIASAIQKRHDDAAAATSVRNEDIVIWHTFGSTHNPRIEDWPVMPAEKMVVGLKPVNFFTGNPAIDVAAATQERNKSVLVNGEAGRSCHGE